jgi:Glyoxalase-like domain
MSDRVDHLVVGSADLETGVRWIEERLGVSPTFGGIHDGWGTINALLGLGEQYLEVLALDPGQPDVSSPWCERLRAMTAPALVTIAVARSSLSDSVPMARVRADGVRMEWELQFTETPLFFIDWKQAPRPTGLPDGGRITSLRLTTPAPHDLIGVERIVVREGPWEIEASINGTPLV